MPSADTLAALAAVITALATLVVAIKALIAVNEVHTMVNQRSTDDKIFQAELVSTLTEAGVKVPVDKSLTAAPPSE